MQAFSLTAPNQEVCSIQPHKASKGKMEYICESMADTQNPSIVNW